MKYPPLPTFNYGWDTLGKVWLATGDVATTFDYRDECKGIAIPSREDYLSKKFTILEYVLGLFSQEPEWFSKRKTLDEFY